MVQNTIPEEDWEEALDDAIDEWHNGKLANV